MLTVDWPFVLGCVAPCVLKSSCLSFGNPAPLFLEAASNLSLCLQAGILVHICLETTTSICI